MPLAEPASSLTDFLLGLVLAMAAFSLRGYGVPYSHWRRAFTFFGIAAIVGGVHHGFLIEYEAVAGKSRALIIICIAAAITFVLAATAAIVLKGRNTKPLMAIRFGSLLAFLVIALLGYASLTTLMISEGVAMAIVLALWVYGWKIGLPGSGLILVAIAASIGAGVVRSAGVSFFLGGWEFNPDAVYHLVQIPGMALLYFAVRPKLASLESYQSRGLKGLF